MALTDRRDRLRIADVYARALHDVARRQDTLDRVRVDIDTLATVLASNEGLGSALQSPMNRAADRRRMLDQLASDFSGVVSATLAAMDKRGRLGLIGEMVEAFKREDRRRQGQIDVELTLPAEVDEHILDDLTDLLARWLGKTPVVARRIDPNILGGFVVRAGDLLIDASVKTQLEKTRRTMLARSGSIGQGTQ